MYNRYNIFIPLAIRFRTSFQFIIYLSIFIQFLFFLFIQVPRCSHGPKLRDTFYSSNVRKSWHQTISLQIEFAGGRGSWPRPLSLQIALNQINVVTYWWIWVTIAWKKVVTPSGGNYLIGIKNWLPREYK